MRNSLRFAAGLGPVDATKGRPDIGRHLAGIAADVNHRPGLEELPHLVLAFQDKLLNIGLGLSILS